MSASYNLKIEDVSFVVNIDNSYSDIFNFAPVDDYVCSLKHQHSHLGYELFFVHEQPITLFVEDKVEQYKNCALCVPPHFNHLSFRQNDYRLHFNIEMQSKKNDSSFAKFIYDVFTNKQPFQLKTNAQIYAYVKELEEILSLEQNLVSEMVICILKLIFYKLYRLNRKEEETKYFADTKNYLMEIEEMINNFNNDLSMQTIADNLCLSIRQASRIVHKYYDKSLSELILERKLNAACRLLQYTDCTVAQIVEKIAFSSESYFYSQFKKIYGCTPKEYKEQRAEFVKT